VGNLARIRDLPGRTLQKAPLDVVVYRLFDHTRSRITTDALLHGITVAGDRAVVRPAETFNGKAEHQVAVFYGLEGPLANVFEAYSTDERRAVYIDLGYFGRREGGRFAGFHKIVVNSRHPTEYFQAPAHPSDRFDRFAIDLKPLRHAGRHILLCGMSDKGAIAEGFRPNQWETETILRQICDRPIRYRPKPSWKRARPLQGSDYADVRRPIEDDLRDCHCLVSHHSNAAIDALIAGVPAITVAGAASVLSHFDDIHDPYFPSRDRLQQFLADLCYTQWRVEELADGSAWRHLKQEGLLL
jgi:hypothetical protein